MPSRKQLQQEFDATRGLFCIRRNPAEVDYEWIRQNAFELKDNLKDEPDLAEIQIGTFTLKQAATAGKICMTDASGQETEVDEKVLEDMLRSFF